MRFPRRTVADSVRIEGLGLHSGAPVQMTIHPASEGIAFRCGAERVQALPENVSETSRCTRLGGISTVEHLMSAFCGLEVTDAEVELSHPELPGMDGSSRPFVDRILQTGTCDFAEGEAHDLYRRLFVKERDVSISIGKGPGAWRYEFDLEHHSLGIQVFETAEIFDSYVDEVSPARTTVFLEEIPLARQAGLGKGLDESAVLVIGAGRYENQPRFSNEPARHKLLDLMGDLYLSGFPARALSVVAVRSGHAGGLGALTHRDGGAERRPHQ